MLPLPSAFPARLPSLAEVEHGVALREHCLLTFCPGGSGAVGVEERVNGRGVLGVVHTHDPLAPGQILDWFPLVSPFPVQDCRDLMGGWVEQDVVRPVITVHQHASDPVLIPT